MAKPCPAVFGLVMVLNVKWPIIWEVKTTLPGFGTPPDVVAVTVTLPETPDPNVIVTGYLKQFGVEPIVRFKGIGFAGTMVETGLDVMFTGKPVSSTALVPVSSTAITETLKGTPAT
jgi:hypothetical protein